MHIIFYQISPFFHFYVTNSAKMCYGALGCLSIHKLVRNKINIFYNVILFIDIFLNI